MKKLRVLALAVLAAFLISLGASRISFAPYHTPPPTPPPGVTVQELSLIHVLFHPGNTKLIAENKGLIFATTTELKRGAEVRIFNATTDPGEKFHSPIAIVNEAGRRISFDIVDPADPTKVLQAGATSFGLEQGKPVAIRFKAETAGKLKITHADHGHPIELTLEVK